MTWLALRQFRMQSFVALAALLAVALFVAITGPHLAHLYNTSGIAACRVSGGDCGSLQDQFLRNYSRIRPVLDLLLLAIPVVVGMFWGAPLIAREFEAGTFRLAWTQGVTRSRWLGVKLAVVGLAAVVLVGLVSWMLTWWYHPIDTVLGNRFLPGVFDERGLVPFGYAAFALAVGVSAGLLLKRSLPAMAVTLAVFIGTRLAFTTWLRPLLVGPAHLAMGLTSVRGSGIVFSPIGVTMMPGTPNIANAWVYSTQIVDHAGKVQTAAALHQFIQSVCPAMAAVQPPPGLDVGSGNVHAGPVAGPGPQGAAACWTQAAARFHLLVTYQPASRFWPFQEIETAIFIALAAVLAGLCFWLIRRRRA